MIQYSSHFYFYAICDKSSSPVCNRFVDWGNRLHWLAQRFKGNIIVIKAYLIWLYYYYYDCLVDITVLCMFTSLSYGIVTESVCLCLCVSVRIFLFSIIGNQKYYSRRQVRLPRGSIFFNALIIAWVSDQTGDCGSCHYMEFILT